MKKFIDLETSEQEKIQNLVSNWLKAYTDECINHVMNQMNDIINNQMAMKLLENLYGIEVSEMKSFKLNIYFALRECETEFIDELKTKRFHDLSKKSKGYRDVLYDLYIAGYSKAFE